MGEGGEEFIFQPGRLLQPRFALHKLPVGFLKAHSAFGHFLFEQLGGFLGLAPRLDYRGNPEEKTVRQAEKAEQPAEDFLNKTDLGQAQTGKQGAGFRNENQQQPGQRLE